MSEIDATRLFPWVRTDSSHAGSQIMKTLSPFLTPFVLGIGLYFVEALWVSASRRLILFLLIAFLSLSNILISPYSSPMLNFLTGMGSAWYIIWSGDLLFIQDPRTFKRLQGHVIAEAREAHVIYTWQPIPEPHTLSRFFWVLDLVTNLRELGWEHGLHKDSIPLLQRQGRNSSSLGCTSSTCPTRTFLISQIKRATPAYLFMFIYEQAPLPEQDLILSYMPCHVKSIVYHNVRLWSWTIYVHFLLKFTHCIIAITAVGLFGKNWLGTAGEPWMYPPIFGSASSFFTTWKIQAFWGQWWHNVLRRSLLSIPCKIVPVDGSAKPNKFLLVLASFVLSASFHAAACYCVLRDVRAAGLIFFCFSLQPFPIIFQSLLSRVAATNEPAVALLARGSSVCIGFIWMSWTFPLAMWNPAILSVQETFRISGSFKIFK